MHNDDQQYALYVHSINTGKTAVYMVNNKDLCFSVQNSWLQSGVCAWVSILKKET